MKRRIIAVVCLSLCIASPAEEYRIWTDRNGKTLEAMLIDKTETQIKLRDKKGRGHSIDPKKLSNGDQLYLYPSPPPPPEPLKYRLTPRYTSRKVQNKNDIRKDRTTVSFEYEFTLKVDFLAGDTPEEELRGALFIMGWNPDGGLVVIDKTEAPIEKVGDRGGQVRGTDFELTQTTDEDQKWIEGTKYRGYLVVLYAKDGTVLETQCSHQFLEKNLEKTFSLNVGDQFNEQCEPVDTGAP